MIKIGVFISVVAFIAGNCLGQETPASDQIKVLTLHTTDSLKIDTTKIIEDAPLDIAQNRGLFIVTPDQKLQLRILGSVRYLVVFDNMNLGTKNGLNTNEIPAPSDGQNIPNFYNGLDQTRIGFEVTRFTEAGNVFIRLETDFAGENGYRIRHAYGQINQFLLGQTWSLFSHLNATPATVDYNGPTGAVIARVPQIRYSLPNPIGSTNLAFGMEYFPPDIKVPDSISLQTFQLIPDITARLTQQYNWGTFQLSGILPILSGRYNNNLELVTGWGVSGSTVINAWKGGKWYFQAACGKAISRYFNDLSGNGFDIQLNYLGGYKVPFTYGFYGTYEHNWSLKVYSSFTYGGVKMEKLSFTSDKSFHKAHTYRVNTFWDITDGAKAGAEVIWGNRINKNNEKGNATRINMLFYYDF